jgi:uncharacterized membrane protein
MVWCRIRCTGEKQVFISHEYRPPMTYDRDNNMALPPGLGRIAAVDALRGLVMILMTWDHASYAYNAGRYVTDSVGWYTPGSVIPAAQFLARFVTHICAPTFIFLAGLVMAISILRKQGAGIEEKRIDADLMFRGIFILALDPLWMSFGFGGRMVFQVLYAIGGGLCCMVLLRRLGTRWLLAVGLLLMLGSEALAGLALWANDGKSAGPFGAFIASGGRLGFSGYVLYPLLPWLSYMILGFACGRLMNRGTIENPKHGFLLTGLILLALFVVVRGINGYGNMLLYRDNLHLLQWLHVSKYPPSLSFGLLTLGLMCLCLAALMQLYPRKSATTIDPLLVFGRTPLFFYILHVHLLTGSAKALGLWKGGGLLTTAAATLAVLALLHPLCRWFAKVKRAHPQSLLKFI